MDLQGKSVQADVLPSQNSEAVRAGLPQKLPRELGRELAPLVYATLLWTWVSIVRRTTCRDPGVLKRCYLDRGIRLWGPWLQSPWAFVAWVDQHLGGKPSPKHSLDRIDNDRGYEPGNLRWATPKEQVRNCRTARRVTVEGRVEVLCDLAERYGLAPGTVRQRLNRGWSLDEALRPLEPQEKRRLRTLRRKEEAEARAKRVAERLEAGVARARARASRKANRAKSAAVRAAKRKAREALRAQGLWCGNGRPPSRAACEVASAHQVSRERAYHHLRAMGSLEAALAAPPRAPGRPGKHASCDVQQVMDAFGWRSRDRAVSHLSRYGSLEAALANPPRRPGRPRREAP